MVCARCVCRGRGGGGLEGGCWVVEMGMWGWCCCRGNSEKKKEKMRFHSTYHSDLMRTGGCEFRHCRSHPAQRWCQDGLVLGRHATVKATGWQRLTLLSIVTAGSRNGPIMLRLGDEVGFDVAFILANFSSTCARVISGYESHRPPAPRPLPPSVLIGQSPFAEYSRHVRRRHPPSGQKPSPRVPGS